MGVRLALDTDLDTVMLSDLDDGPCRVLAARYPDTPNMGDVTRIDFTRMGHVDVLCGGSPCQSVSLAGMRAGMSHGTRSGLWSYQCDAIAAARPALAVWENVSGALSARASSRTDVERADRRARLLSEAGLCGCDTPRIDTPGYRPPKTGEGADTLAKAWLDQRKRHAEWPEPANLTCAACGLHVFETVNGKTRADGERLDGVLTEPVIRALGRVLGDLANIGYDAVWRGMEAAWVGAPHHRLRIFVIAWPATDRRLRLNADPWAEWNPDRDLWETGMADLLGERDVFMGAWPRNGLMTHGGAYTLPAQWTAPPTPGGMVMPTPLGRDGRGGSLTPEEKKAGGHAVTLQDMVEKDPELMYTPRASDGTFGRAAASGRPLDKSTSLTTQARLFDLPGMLATPNCMDMLPARSGDAYERILHRGDPTAPRRASTGNLREDVTALRMLPTPSAAYDAKSQGSPECSKRRVRLGRQLGLGDTINLTGFVHD